MNNQLSLEEAIKGFADYSIKYISFFLDKKQGQKHFPFSKPDTSLLESLTSERIISSHAGHYVSRVFVPGEGDKTFPVLDEKDNQIYFRDRIVFDMYVRELENLAPRGCEFYRDYKGD